VRRLTAAAAVHPFARAVVAVAHQQLAVLVLAHARHPVRGVVRERLRRNAWRDFGAVVDADRHLFRAAPSGTQCTAMTNAPPRAMNTNRQCCEELAQRVHFN